MQKKSSTTVRTARRADSEKALGGGRLSDKAFNVLEQAITRCELTPGQIVSEREIEEQYSLSKVSIRLAMDRLIQLKLVKPIHRRGFEIAPILLADIRENFELRRMVEPQCFGKASQQKVDLDALRKLDQLMLKHPVSTDRMIDRIVIDANREFHLTVIRACGNARITALMSKILTDIDRAYYYGLMRHPKFYRMQEHHGEMFKALEAHDAVEAERLAREHIDQGYAIAMDAIMSAGSLSMSVMPIRF